MATYYAKAIATDNVFSGLHRRCSVCGQFNRLDRNVRLGRYAAPSTVTSTDAVRGKSYYADNASSCGCAFCASPLWADGGQRGDLGRWT